MKTTAYVTHPDCSLHDTGWAHPDHQGRLAAVARAVYRDMLTLHDPLLEMEPEPASVDDLLLAHSGDYVERVRRAAEEAERIGEVQPFGAARISGRSWDAGRAAAGCGIAAADAVLEGTVRNAFCAVRPPGSDVGRDGGNLYGLFNTVAIAAAHVRARRDLGRVLILEIAATPGHGTAEIAARDPGIRFATVHQRPAERVSWPPGTIAVALDAGAGAGADGGAAEAITALEQGLAEVSDGFLPELILLSLGLDALRGDPLGGLCFGPRAIYELTRGVTRTAGDLCDGRLVSVLEGGYDARASGTAVVQHLRALAGLEPA